MSKKVNNWLEEFEDLKEYITYDCDRISYLLKGLREVCHKSEEVPDIYIGFKLGELHKNLETIRTEMLEKVSIN